LVNYPFISFYYNDLFNLCYIKIYIKLIYYIISFRIDAIPLSRPKRNIARDFSDGVMLAEVVAAYFPHLVELHNYTKAHSIKQKIYNIDTLNTRVLRKIGYFLSHPIIEDIVNCKAGVVESVLHQLQYKMAKYKVKKAKEDENSIASSPRINQQQQKQHQHQQHLHSQQQQSNQSQQNSPKQQFHQKKSQQPSLQQQSNHGCGRSNYIEEEKDNGKDQQIIEQAETIKILELKISKLEQLVRIKDNRIQKLTSKSD
jgi:hypothetical protein